MELKIKEIVDCGTCPFVSDADGDPEMDWTCHAEYDSNGWPMSLGRKCPETIPTTCPLRTKVFQISLAQRVRRRGIDFPCENCGGMGEPILADGWYRCRGCGYPSK
jgi:hypothetical protein